MALMTSCPACNTRFKVVPDQLRLHHGLVRCGACDHVFDANNRLEALPEQSEQAAQAHQPSQDAALNPQGWLNKPAVQALSQPGGGQHETLAAHGLGDPPWTQVQPNQVIERHTAYTAHSLLLHSLTTHSLTAHNLNKATPEFESTGARRRHVKTELSDLHTAGQPRFSGAETDANATAAIEASDAKHAEQAERRRRRAEKKRLTQLQAAHSQTQATVTEAKHEAAAEQAWGNAITLAGALICTLLACVLVSQIALASRYALANALPAIKPVLTQLCSFASCQLEPAQWLSPLSLDALSLVKTNAAPATAESQAYRMQATVRNASELIVKTPDIELSISNAQGQLIARKTLSAKDLGAAPTLAPNSDWQLDSSVLLDALTLGYTARLVHLP